MRYGCCLNMVAAETGGTGAEHLNDLARMGYDYVELPLAEIMTLGEEGQEKLRRALVAAGIPCEACNNFFPRSFRLTGEEVDLPSVLAYAEKALSVAQSLGVKVVVFGSGPAKNVPEGFPMEEAFLQMVELLKGLDPLARDRGITIVLEPLRKAECNLINNFKEGVALAKAANLDNIRVLVDFYHLTVEEEPAEDLLPDGRAYLRHVHLANPAGRVYPRKLEEAEYVPFIQALKGAGYDGRVSCEAYSQDFLEDAPKTLAFLKTHFA